MTRIQTARLVHRAVAVAACLLALATGAGAATDEELFREFRFSFISPGGRALGMGGAVVSLADDVTAAAANPAGLYFATSPQLFAELRAFDGDASIAASEVGSLDVDPTSGARELPFGSLTTVSAPESSVDPTFIGYAWPLELGSTNRRLTLALSRQVVMADERTLKDAGRRTEARVAFESFPNTVVGGEVRTYSISAPVEGRLVSDIVYWNGSAGLEVHPDFSIGFTVSFATLDLAAESMTRVEDPLALVASPAHPRLPGLPQTDLLTTGVDDTDESLAYSIGLHWHPDSAYASGDAPWSLGAIYRKGADFEVVETASLNGIPVESFGNRIIIPDRFSVGADYRLDERWTLALEVERIEFTDMLIGFRSGFNFLTTEQVAGFFGTDPNQEVAFEVDDGTLPRFGVEYARPWGSRRLSYSGGYYRQPDGRIRMTRFNSTDPAINDVYLEAFGGADDENHFTAGVGLTLGRSAVHLAGDFSDSSSQVVGSYIYSFGER